MNSRAAVIVQPARVAIPAARSFSAWTVVGSVSISRSLVMAVIRPELSPSPKALSTSLRRRVMAPSTVSGSFCAASVNSGSALSVRSVITSAVSCPSDAMARSAPTETPKPLASARRSGGAASAMALNSSPRRTPELIACENWVRVEEVSAEVAPLMRSALVRASTTAMASRLRPI
ncbi:hypothetical protein D9M70_520590 [compost metagenome]